MYINILLVKHCCYNLSAREANKPRIVHFTAWEVCLQELRVSSVVKQHSGVTLGNAVPPHHP